MHFTSKALFALEYDKIIGMLASMAATEGAAAKARALSPTDDYDTVLTRQRRTDDAKRLINAKGYPSFSAPESTVSSAERAYKGAVLSPRELLDIASLLYSARNLQDYIKTDKTFDTSLDELFDRILVSRSLEDRIKKAIISEDMIADEASFELAEIRRKIRNTNNKIKDTLQSYVGGNKLKYLQENIVTMRNGRYVVPVKAEYRNELKGLVHDTSSTGATLFVEPMAVVEANNELKSLSAAEKYEIERILASLSKDCADASSVITLNYHNITEIAFVYACASLAISMKAEMPKITKKRLVNLRRARHPLLDKDKVVPIDVAVGEDFDTLVITGPNTGGKTVSLKTVGLLTLMAASGLQIPALENSEVGVFDGVLVDIGDEQSIEASLSTFSSHMVNVVGILNTVGPRTMVLFDELGSGTDPIEGAALATAILEKTQSLGALTLATTHYAELKAYALDTPRVQNASCEFDVDTLRPTYKLVVGTPGKSNAFAISEKLGIPSDVLTRADQLIARDNKRFEDVIERLDTDRMKMEAAREKAEELRSEYEKFKLESEQELKKKISKTEDETQKTLLKAKQILDSARASSEFIFRQLEAIKKAEDKETRDRLMLEARDAVRESLRKNDDMLSGITVKEYSLDDDYKLPRPLKIGDKVYVITVGTEGVVTALADKKGLIAVTAGVLKTKVTEDKLRLVEANTKYREKKTPRQVSEGKVKRSVVSDFKIEVDVRGMIGDDAWFVVDKHLDDAILANVPFVRIIHGKGTGALRAALWKYFKSDKRIKTYKHAEYGDGDAGVTVIELKH
ncbi:MAG: endonuclease MutS2 [Ruminococcaceae bacterium]|nr:endonuclease MutS2 [Oscillospiraceae bacterium]